MLWSLKLNAISYPGGSGKATRDLAKRVSQKLLKAIEKASKKS
ncbi:MAG TPA: hypothetical protein VNN73_02030 [Blastocatellia bacterium]|nr:hypothetical protein [Blastocatellia bacterium]